MQEIDNSFDKVMWIIVALPNKYSLDCFFNVYGLSDHIYLI